MTLLGPINIPADIRIPEKTSADALPNIAPILSDRINPMCFFDWST
jgi:hypothetical protein